MSVISLAIHDGQDPNGTPLVTLTDNDVASFEMRMAENELGAGKFTIRRDHASATAANLAAGNYVKVTIPIIDTDPIMGFWLDEHDDTILARNEEGAEVLERSGAGTLAILGRAALLDQFYNGPLGGAARGNYSAPGNWTWTQEPYGAILVRLIEEGQLEPGTPLGDVTIDFVRTLDSNGNAWPDVEELIEFPIGTDGLTVYQRLIASGYLFVRADPDLAIHGYGTSPGVDRSSGSFASGKVRFVKGENINTELRRSGHGSIAATHALVVGKDLTYRQVVSPDYSTGTGRWTTVDYDNSNDPDLLDKVGDQDLIMRKRALEGVEFEIRAGDDDTTGLYLPWKHFQPGDLVTLHTGSEDWDYNEATARLIGFRIVLGEASDDSTTQMAARSLRVIVELNWGPTSGRLGATGSSHGLGDCPFFMATADGSIMRMRNYTEDHYHTIGASLGDGTGDDSFLAIEPLQLDINSHSDAGEYAFISLEGDAGNIDVTASGAMIFQIDGTGNGDKYYFNGGIGGTNSIVFPQRDSDPGAGASEEGQVYYNSTDNVFRWHNGTAWATFGATGSADADDVSITDAGGYYVSTDVEGALQELGAERFWEAGTGTAIKLKSGFNDIRNNAQTVAITMSAGGDTDFYQDGYLALAVNNGTNGGADTDKHYLYGGHGVVVPKLAADPASGASEAGQIYFNTTSDTFRGYDGTAWGELALI